MILLLISVLLADPDVDRARALLALAAAQVQAAKSQPAEKLPAPKPPASPSGLGKTAGLVWRPTTDPEQSALFRGTVQIGVWHHGKQVYWPCSPDTATWGTDSPPPIPPPARSLRAAPTQLLGPARQAC